MSCAVKTHHCCCVTSLARPGPAHHSRVALASHSDASSIVPPSHEVAHSGAASAHACSRSGARTPSASSKVEIARRIRLDGSSQSVPYGRGPRRLVGGGASGRWSGVSVRGAGRRSKRWSKGAAHASRFVRKLGSSKSRLIVATMDVPSYCESANGRTEGSETTVPFASHGEMRMTGSREPSRAYGSRPRGSRPWQEVPPPSKQKQAGWSSGGGAAIGGGTWS
mmetsp:Transcript_17528/g.51867  ORF Transcript_17528/g.51867 Transcript_17528/m.51867 type:complete len:223 (-) Transcript_17528:1044-1712(-)